MAMTFTVNLETVGLYGNKEPYTSSESTNFKSTRSTWFPNNILANRVVKNGDTITVSGKQAIYLRDNFTSGTYAFLTYVSGSA